MTNYERIKNMSVEDFADFLYTISECENNLCDECPLEKCVNRQTIAEWLESEVETE